MTKSRAYGGAQMGTPSDSGEKASARQDSK